MSEQEKKDIEAYKVEFANYWLIEHGEEPPLSHTGNYSCCREFVEVDEVFKDAFFAGLSHARSEQDYEAYNLRKEIEKRGKRIKLLGTMIRESPTEFYADEKSWNGHNQYLFSDIVVNDCQYLTYAYAKHVGGKRAREYELKYKDELLKIRGKV